MKNVAKIFLLRSPNFEIMKKDIDFQLLLCSDMSSIFVSYVLRFRCFILFFVDLMDLYASISLSILVLFDVDFFILPLFVIFLSIY